MPQNQICHQLFVPYIPKHKLKMGIGAQVKKCRLIIEQVIYYRYLVARRKQVLT